MNISIYIYYACMHIYSYVQKEKEKVELKRVGNVTVGSFLCYDLFTGQLEVFGSTLCYSPTRESDEFVPTSRVKKN